MNRMTPHPDFDLHLVSMRRLEELLGRNRADLQRIASHAGRYYCPFDEQVVEGGKWRHIDNPTKELKELQRRILRTILEQVPFPDTVLGGIRGASVKRNAEYHARQPFLIALDLRDCFPRIHDRQVYRAFRIILGCSAKIAALLTKLTTFQHRLPQGAPTSSLLCNLVLLSMHDEIQAILRGRGAACTFWIDDITISGPEVLTVLEPIVRVIQRHGHAIRRSKLRRSPCSDRQETTGLVVNRGPSTAREYRRGIEAALFSLSREKTISESALQRIRGQILYVRQIRPGQAVRIERLLEKAVTGKPTSGPIRKLRRIRTCSHTRRHRRRTSMTTAPRK